MKLFETSGTGFWDAVRSSWSFGGWKYFRHNLTCELRRCRYETCWDYKNTWYDHALFSFGVFLMDPLGSYHKKKCEWEQKFRRSHLNTMIDTQWTRHPLFWVRRRAVKQIAWLKSQKSI